MFRALIRNFFANRAQRRNAIFPPVRRIPAIHKNQDIFEPRTGGGMPTIASLLAEKPSAWAPKPKAVAVQLTESMDQAAGRKPVLDGKLPATAHTPNDYLGFAEGWQNRLPGKASADAVARFDRLRNSLDHYAYYFAANKQARVAYRNAYAEMRAIFLQLSKERYVFSPHDAEQW